jgi:hypothetical protein
MDTGKKLSELKDECDALGLVATPSGKSGRLLKKDYVKQLMIYNLKMKYGSLDNIPINVKFRLSFESPQLAYGYFDLKQKEQDDIWDSKDIWLVEKINGVRATMITSKREGWSLFSRDISDHDYLWTDYASRILGSDNLDILPENGVFDVEIQLNNNDVKERLRELNYEVVSDFQVITALLMLSDDDYKAIYEEYPDIFKFKLIDIYFYGKDARKLPYRDRESKFDSCVTALKNLGLKIDRPAYCKDPVLKKAFHEGIMKEGGEGTIATYANNPCVLTGSRKRDGMVKIKRPIFPLLFEPNALKDNVDGWVSKIVKYTKDTELIHTIEVMAHKDGEDKVVALCEAIPLSVRQSGLLKEGVVVELSGTKWDDEGMIEDSEVVNVRIDRSKETCIIGEN